MRTAEEYLYWFEQYGFVREQTARGVYYRLPPHLGEGGFELLGDLATCYACITDVLYKKPCIVQEGVAEKMLEFGQFTQGEVTFYRQRSELFPVDFGLNVLVNFPYVTGYKRMAANRRLRNTGFVYREAFFNRLPWPMPGDFWEAAAAVLNPDVIRLPAVTLICEQLHSCRLSGTALAIYIQGKGLEALALLLEYTYAHRGSERRLTAEDRACLEQVAARLRAELRNPPTIPQLARSVGFGEQKLMTGFRRLYGDTVYGYVKRLRMEMAAELLHTTSMPITSIAKEVGYHGDGHFQQAFRAAYGTTPGGFRREMRLGV